MTRTPMTEPPEAESLRRLHATENELRAVLFSISHDVRAPLRAINGFALALQEDHAQALGEAGLEHVARIRSAATRMDHMLEGVLRISRIAAKKPECERTDVSHMARDIVSGFRENFPPHAVEVEVESGLELMSDRTLVRALLHELLCNAWKFTRGAPGARIRVRREPSPPGWFCFSVRDNGHGFDPAQAGERLFGLFQCFHDRTQIPGEGVGLAVARRAAQVLGGDLRAESKPGQGAAFFCTLPCPR